MKAHKDSKIELIKKMKISVEEKLAMISSLITTELFENMGSGYRNPDTKTFYFFDTSEKTLMDISGIDYTCYLRSIFGLPDKDLKEILSSIRTYIWAHGKIIEPKNFCFFDKDNYILYLSDCRNQIYKITENKIEKVDKLQETLQEKIEDISNKTVLGIDIYKYSQYKSLPQFLIPFLFNSFYKRAMDLCLSESMFIFQKYNKDSFGKYFIDTGDVGFQIFETPIHALVFTIYFALVVRLYNSFHFYPKLRELIGPITLRYAITHDSIYEISGNYYGTSIINNARILSKDSLNRFLIDANTHEWFMLNINGEESLSFFSIHRIKNLKDFKNYDHSVNSDECIFPKIDKHNYRIHNVIVQKIEDIKVKSDKLSIYNFYLQFFGEVWSEDVDSKNKTKRVPIELTLGNINISGLN